MAIGRLVPWIDTALSQFASPGIRRPSSRPAAIASPIHRGRNRSTLGIRATTWLSSEGDVRVAVGLWLTYSIPFFVAPGTRPVGDGLAAGGTYGRVAGLSVVVSRSC